MSTTFILLYILAVIAALLAMAGIVMIVFGLVTKNKKTVMHGSIVTGIAVICIITGLFFGARKCFHFCQKNCHNKEMKCMDMDKDFCKMKCESMMMDSNMNGDTCKMTIEKKCMMNDDKQCDPSKCDPSKCPHHNK